MWDFFSVDELKCSGTDECEMDEEFMEKLVALRKEFNEPMIISSGYRSIAYNTTIGGASNSPHLYGKAVDVLVSGKTAYRLMKLAIQHGFTPDGDSIPPLHRAGNDKRQRPCVLATIRRQVNVKPPPL